MRIFCLPINTESQHQPVDKGNNIQKSMSSKKSGWTSKGQVLKTQGRQRKHRHANKHRQCIVLTSQAIISSRMRKCLAMAPWVMASAHRTESESHRISRFQPSAERFAKEPFSVHPLITGPKLWKDPPVLRFSGGEPGSSKWNTSLLSGQFSHYTSQLPNSTLFVFKLDSNDMVGFCMNLAGEGLQPPG